MLSPKRTSYDGDIFVLKVRIENRDDAYNQQF